MTQQPFTPEHGGDLHAACAEFGHPPDSWMDLSTGISPWVYPSHGLPAHIWQQLPGNDSVLRQAASDYYRVRTDWVLPVPGSQYALSRIPHLVPKGRVAVPLIGYREHQNAWQQAGHQVLFYHDFKQLRQWVEQGAVEHWVLINPNNPTTEKVGVADIAELAQMHGGGGLMLIDEAFADCHNGPSGSDLLESYPNLWVLRSLGKFFGLAGLRLGFLLGRDGAVKLAQPLRSSLTPWGINHPAQWLGTQALGDKDWQDQQRQRIAEASAHLAHFWQKVQSEGKGQWSVHNGGLFVTLRGPYQVLYPLYQRLGRQGIYLRWCHWPENTESSSEPWLRCGLPEDGGIRLQRALADFSPN